jgi:hypothetical protein
MTREEYRDELLNGEPALTEWVEMCDAPEAANDP